MSFSCSTYNDIFGFFISGPGYAASTNIALIPGTLIPITINSTTDPAITMPLTLVPCTSMGPGSPFAQYYVDNRTSTAISYFGFTRPFEVRATLIPCKVYHLKMAIADCDDGHLDSGVFLKAGSFTADSLVKSTIRDLSYCFNAPIPPLSARSGPLAHQWDNGDTSQVHDIHAPGTYWVKYDGCQDLIDTFHVHAYPIPPPFSLGEDTVICAGYTQYELRGPAGYRYRWQDNSTLATIHVTNPGAYILTISNGHCNTSDTALITTRQCNCRALMPTAFTPNGDGLNDRLIPKLTPDCLPAKDFVFRVFDRWGRQVYAAFTPGDKGWDGTFHNKQSEIGTYFYELRYQGQQMDEEEFAKGDVTLVR